MPADALPPPAIHAEPPRPLAAGGDPPWLVTRAGGVLTLLRLGRPPLSAPVVVEAAPPAGRTIRASAPGGTGFTIRFHPGRCLSAAFGETPCFAWLAVDGEAQRRGCGAVNDAT